MKFLIDAQLPPSLRRLFIERGYDAIHTLDLPLKNDTKDLQIRQIAVQENRIVISKDIDFYDSFILKQEPPKLVLVKTGNISTKDLKALFDSHFDDLVKALKNHDLVILSKIKMNIP